MKQEIIKTKPDKEIEERLIYIREQLKFIPNIFKLNRVYIEALSFGSVGKNDVLAAVHYIVRCFLYENKVTFKIIQPTKLKKFVGKGNFKKNQMLLKVYKRWGVEFESDDLADAYSLARYALSDFLDEQKEIKTNLNVSENNIEKEPPVVKVVHR